MSGEGSIGIARALLALALAVLAISLSAPAAAPAAEITGTIEPTPSGDTEKVTFSSPGDFARFSVPVTAGESVSITTSEATLGGSYQLEWLDSEEESAGGWLSSGEAAGFIGAVTFTEAGTATLVIDPQGEATGAITFTLYNASDKTSDAIVPSPEGSSGSFSVDVPGQRELIALEGLEGQMVSIVPRYPGFEGQFHVLTPKGETVAGSGGDLSAAHGPFELPEYGVYEIVLTGDEGETGSVRLCARLEDEISQSDRCALVASYSFDESEGSVASDGSGNGHDGTIEGAAWESGIGLGSALRFDGEDDLVTVADAADLRLGEFTLEAWVKFEEPAGEMPVVTKMAPSSYGYQLQAGSGEPGYGGARVVDGAATEHEATDPQPLVPEAWNHLIATNDGEDLRLYVNGHLVDESAAAALGTGPGPLEIGASTGFAEDEFFAGKVDEVRIYDRALSTAQIAREWNWMPVLFNTPYIEGAAEDTKTLFASPGIWEGVEPLEFKYQWERCPPFE